MAAGEWTRRWRTARATINDVVARHQERTAVTEELAGADVAVERLVELARSTDPAIRALAARHANMPVDWLARLAAEPVPPAPGRQPYQAEQDYQRIRRAVAANRSAPEDVLTQLASDPAPNVREAVAYNPSSGPEILDGLAGDHARHVLFAVAGNRSASPELLRKLAGRATEGDNLLSVIKASPNCPEDLQQQYAHDQPKILNRRALLEMGKAINWVRQAARREAHEHPDDPAVAVLGLRSAAVKNNALAFARRDDTTTTAVDELRRVAGSDLEAINRAQLWLRCDGQAEEQPVENLAHRLLEAARSHHPVEALGVDDRERLVALEGWRQLPDDDAIADLLARQPALADLATGPRPIGGRPDSWQAELPRYWFAASVPYLVRHLPAIAAQPPPIELIELMESLENLLGPTSGATDPILRSHTALNRALSLFGPPVSRTE